MKIGFNEATGKGCSTLAQDLALCEEIGFDFIEIRLDMLHDYLRTYTIEELARYLAASRLKPNALNALYLYEGLFISEDARQAEWLADFDFACQAAETLGAGALIVVPPLMEDRKTPYVADWPHVRTTLADMMGRLGARAAAKNVKLCFELVGAAYSSVRTIQHAREVVEAVALPNVGYVFDTYNIYLNHRCEDFAQMAEAELEKVFAIHINDSDDSPAAEMNQDRRCFCGEGILDLSRYLQPLRRMGYQGMVSIETFRPAYWQQSPRWVVENAYRTTRQTLAENDCL